MSAEVVEKLPNLQIGPDPSISYPIHVQYCGNCSLPIEVIFITLLHIANEIKFYYN